MNSQTDQPEVEAEDLDAGEESLAEQVEAIDQATEIEALKAKADENWDRYLRAAAETENVRKRAARDVENARKYALENFGRELLGVVDTLEMGRAAAIEKINTVLGDAPVYISIDIDGLDPAYMPGTGVPEIGGILPRDMQVILRSLQGKDIIGADICEIAPSLDPTGITCITAANLIFEMLCITADSVAKRKGLSAQTIAAHTG